MDITSIRLLSGADIQIRYDRQGKKYTAKATVGYSSRTAVADDPLTALALAVILQAGYTESKLKKALGVQPAADQGEQAQGSEDQPTAGEQD